MKKSIRYVIYLILFTILIGAFIYLGKKDYSDNLKKLTDGEKFNLEYNDVPKNNMFKYIYSTDLSNTLESGTGLIFIGFSSNEWAQYYVKYLYQVLEEKNVKNVYYYDLLKDRLRYTKYYVKIENKLSNHLIKLDDNTKRLNTPLFIIVKNGNILYVNKDTSNINNDITTSMYWNYNQIMKFKEEISNNIERFGIYG